MQAIRERMLAVDRPNNQGRSRAGEHSRKVALCPSGGMGNLRWLTPARHHVRMS